MRAARRRVEAADHRYASALAARLPQLRLGASVGAAIIDPGASNPRLARALNNGW